MTNHTRQLIGLGLFTAAIVILAPEIMDGMEQYVTETKKKKLKKNNTEQFPEAELVTEK